MMQDAFHASLKRRLDEVITERQQSIASGLATSFEDYRGQVQYLVALDHVLKICDEIEKKMYGQPMKGQS